MAKGPLSWSLPCYTVKCIDNLRAPVMCKSHKLFMNFSCVYIFPGGNLLANFSGGGGYDTFVTLALVVSIPVSASK